MYMEFTERRKPSEGEAAILMVEFGEYKDFSMVSAGSFFKHQEAGCKDQKSIESICKFKTGGAV